MPDFDTLVGERFSAARPGLSLISVEDAAIPMSWLIIDVLAQERKPFPLLEEFALRTIAAGLSKEDEIALLLGLDVDLVRSAIAELLSREFVTRRQVLDGGWKITLTQLGAGAARELAAVTPVREPLPFAFDRLTWTITAFRKADLVTQSDAKAAGMRILPGRPAELADSEITPGSLNRVLEEQSDSDGRVEILSIQRVTQKARLFLPVKLLVYADETADEVELGILIDDELSRSHELAIGSIGGAEALGIRVEPPVPPPLDDLAPEVAAERLPAAEVAALRASATAVRTGQAFAASVDPLVEARADDATDELNKIAVRSVGVHEHRDLLLEALTSSRSRLLIISPWVKRAVVNTEFLSLLEQRLRRGVKVHIAHGYGPDDSGSDESALRTLQNLQKRFPDRFELARLENTHAKILVWDNAWVLTSFNWLSYKGDPNRTYRMEEGTLVRTPNLVDEAYERYVALIDRDRRR